MVLAKLANYGIPNKLAFQIQDFYKEETLEIVENYPYQLVEDIKGLGFTIADQLAQELGIESQAPERFRAGLKGAWKREIPIWKLETCWSKPSTF